MFQHEAFGSLTKRAEGFRNGHHRTSFAAVQEAIAYARQGRDAVRERFEGVFLERTVNKLLPRGGTLLDLGCGHGWASRLGRGRLGRYIGVDLRDPGPDLPGSFVQGHLRDGLPSLGGERFDLCVAGFGLASHLAPAELSRLLGQLARRGRPGALVAIEAMGLRSLEWPRLWKRPVGAARTIPYRLGADVAVHPWAPEELFALFEDAGMEPLGAQDRSVQAGPKAGEGRYWQLPPLRAALDALLAGGTSDDTAREARAALTAPLGPLPWGPAAHVHHQLATRRRRLLEGEPDSGASLARKVWALEPRSSGGYGHGLLLIARVA